MRVKSYLGGANSMCKGPEAACLPGQSTGCKLSVWAELGSERVDLYQTVALRVLAKETAMHWMDTSEKY